MSAAANVKTISTEKNRPVKPGETFIYGKIQHVEKYKTKQNEVRYRTRVLMKSDDDFGYPNPYDVVSSEPIGVTGEIFEGVARSRTFRKDYTTKPDENGEVKVIRQITCEWDLVG